MPDDPTPLFICRIEDLAELVRVARLNPAFDLAAFLANSATLWTTTTDAEGRPFDVFMIRPAMIARRSGPIQ
jgi:hypothetical protein